MSSIVPRDPRDRAATPRLLREAARCGALDAAALAAALTQIERVPDAAAWRRFLGDLLLLAGAVLVAAGTIFFVAYNWADLHRFGRLGLVAAATAAVALGGWRLGLERTPGQVLLGAGVVGIGGMLAVHGQEYQTGADPWQLFALWAVLAWPWVAAARFALLWLLWIGLVDTTLILAWGELLHPLAPAPDAPLMLLLFAVHGLAAGLWEAGRGRGIGWMGTPWVERLLTAAALGVLWVPALTTVLAPQRATGWEWTGLVALLGAVAFVLWRYRWRAPDLFRLAAAVASLVAVVTAVPVSWLEEMEALGFLLVGLLLVAEVAVAVTWLRRADATMGQGGA